MPPSKGSFWSGRCSFTTAQEVVIIVPVGPLSGRNKALGHSQPKCIVPSYIQRSEHFGPPPMLGRGSVFQGPKTPLLFSYQEIVIIENAPENKSWFSQMAKEDPLAQQLTSGHQERRNRYTVEGVTER